MIREKLSQKIMEFLRVQDGYEHNTGWIEQPADEIGENLLVFIESTILEETMSTAPQPPSGQTPNAVLTVLQNVNGYIALGLQVGSMVVPLVKGLIAGIRKIGEGTDTEAYEIVVRTDLAELDEVTKLSTDDLAAINVELERLGAPKIGE